MVAMLLPHVVGFGSGAFLGFSMGYAFKKIFKIIVFIMGSIAILIFTLDYLGFITVHFEKTLTFYDKIIPNIATHSTGLFNYIKTKLPLTAVGFSLGAFWALKK